MFHHFPTIALSAALGAVVFEATQAKPAQLETEAAGSGIEQGWWDHDRRLDRLEGKVEELRETAPANAAETNAVPAGNDLESTNTPTGSGQSAFEQFQRETESRERALSMEKNRLIKERVEQVLRNFVDISGYLRAGYGRNNEGGPQVPFQAPGALAKYRLGNETENYGEVVLGKNWYVPDLFSVDTRAPSEEAVRGPIARTQVRMAFLDPYSNYGSPDTFQTTLPEVWSSVGNLIASQPLFKCWAGNRFYRRHDIHINDFYFLNMSGGGGGFEDLELPFGKLALAWIGDGQQSGVFRDVIHSDPNNKVGFSKQNVDLSLYDFPFLWGKGELALVYANETGGRDVAGNQAPDSDGVALTFIHTVERFIDENGFNKFSLQFGYGAAKTFTSGFEIFTATNGTFIVPDDPHSWRVRLTEHLVVQPNEHFSIGPALVYQFTDHHDPLGSRHWLSGGVRPVLHFNKNLSLAFEAGVDYVEDSVAGTRDYLCKFTLAPQVSVGNLFFSRPVIRAYLTYADWGAQFKGRVGGNDFANRSDGWAWGVQMETWW